MKYYFIAGRQKDIPVAHVPSVHDSCIHCGDKVWIDERMLPVVHESKGIICVPCIEEITGKSLMQLATENIKYVTEILDNAMNKLKGES